MALTVGRRSTLDSKGWKGVRDLIDPYSIPSNFLMRARNVYLPEPGSGVGAYARPGFRLKNAAAQLNAGGYGQAIVAASVEDGTFYNFFACGGKLYRSSDLAVYTDVTPVGVTIDANARVFITPFSNRIIVNDGVNVPWVGSDLASSPITGTEIQYNNALPGGAWKAYGPAVIYQDTPFFIVRQRDGEGVDAGTPQLRVARIAWASPDDPFTGYRQTDFDYEWDVIQNGANPIYALWATNLAIYYFRAESIGTFTGDVGPDLKTTATHDAIDQAIGTRAPASFAAYGNSLYFVDEQGRPQRFVLGKGLDPIWKQLRRVVPNTNAIFPAYTATTAVGAIVPELDLYVVAIYAPDASLGLHQYPTVLYAFDAATGRYVGEWTIGSGCAVHAVGTVVTANGERRLAVMGTKVAPASPQPAGEGGYVWVLAGISDGIWTDGDDDTAIVPDIFVTTPPLGYQADLELTVDRVVAIVSEQAGDTTPKTIEITPVAASIDVDGTQPYTAVVRNAAGVALDLQPDVWTSSAPAVATIDSAGLATGHASGPASATSNITASLTLYGLTSNVAVLTVTDPTVPVSIEVTPTEASIDITATQQLTATVRNIHGAVLPDYPIDAWNSSDPTKATVDGAGLVTGVAEGATNVTASITAPAITSNASAITVVDVITVVEAPNGAVVTGPVELYAVGGGAGGGNSGGGGGGAVQSVAFTGAATMLTVTLGAGGAADTAGGQTVVKNGGVTLLNPLGGTRPIGGVAGGCGDGDFAHAGGGVASAGGGGGSAEAQGGGGGANQHGGDGAVGIVDPGTPPGAYGTGVAGQGGDGALLVFASTVIGYYGAGGGGGGTTTGLGTCAPGAGGQGGGGNGDVNGAGGNAVPGTGSGGGGGSSSGGTGSQGVFLIAYRPREATVTVL